MSNPETHSRWSVLWSCSHHHAFDGTETIHHSMPTDQTFRLQSRGTTALRKSGSHWHQAKRSDCWPTSWWHPQWNGTRFWGCRV